MVPIKRLLIAAVILVIPLLTAACATTASHGGGNTSSENAKHLEVTGEVVLATPCRTLIEIETAKAGEPGETKRMQFFCLDPAARESASGVGKGDKVKVQYVSSPDTHRNQVRKITKIAEKDGGQSN